MGVNLKSLIGKHPTNRRGRRWKPPPGLCLSRKHYNIEVEHVLIKLLDSRQRCGDDLPAVRRRHVAASGRVNRSLEQAQAANARTPASARPVLNMFRRPGPPVPIDFNAGQIPDWFRDPGAGRNEDLARLMARSAASSRRWSPRS